MNKVPELTKQESWDLIIKPKSGWFEFHLGELYRYRDLIFLFVRRDLVSQYKQTILGPLYFVINPILGTLIFTVIFGKIAKIPTDGIPQFLFYMSGTLLWGYFSTCMGAAKDTFAGNAGLFSQVYFPRLSVPISQAISSLAKLTIQLLVFSAFYIYFIADGFDLRPSLWVLLLPLLVLQCALLGIGFGVLLSSFTTKYRDLNFVYSFLVQGWMYATPIVYPLSVIPEKWHLLMCINPMVGVIECVRQILFGVSSLRVEYILVGVIVNLLVLSLGLLVFTKVERNFLDTV
jgi:lipopolysaccharide transport system permease protein